MNNQTKLILALQQIDNVVQLMKSNEYEQYFNIRLVQIKVELERQLSHYG